MGPAPLRILHVEDDDNDALLVSSALESAGVDFHLVRVQEEAGFVDALRENAPDVVISDNSLPRFSGMRALTLARQLAPDVPFIFVTGTMGEDVAIESLTAGARDYVLKDRLARLPPAILRAAEEGREKRTRRQAEQSLRESEERYRGLVEVSPDAILVHHDGCISYVNPAGVKLLGASEEEDLVGTMMLDRVHPEDRDVVKQRMRLLLEDQAAVPPRAMRWLRLDGSVTHVEVVATAVTLGGRRAIQVIVRDLTERMQLEAQLLQSQKLEAVGTLAGGVAHDFNNLLVPILGHAEMLVEELPDDEALRAHVAAIRAAGTRAAELARQLLAFSRRQVMAPAVLDLNVVVSEVERMLRRVIGEHIRLEFVQDPTIGCIEADKSQIEQVIVNLVVNARDAMEDGGRLTLATSERELRPRTGVGPDLDGDLLPGRYVVLSVTDTGTGMDEATRLRIFEPFFTTKPTGKGTGLGLATVYGIVRQSRGQIRVDSAPGCGTTFEVWLPRADSRPCEAPAARVRTDLRGTETILLVEDETEVRLVARQILKSRGYHVLEAGSTEQALAVLAAHPEEIHLLFTDTVMPGGSGPDLARKVLALRPGMRVLFTSGYAGEVITRQGMLPTGSRLIQKPWQSSTLLEKVREALDAPA